MSEESTGYEFDLDELFDDESKVGYYPSYLNVGGLKRVLKAYKALRSAALCFGHHEAQPIYEAQVNLLGVIMDQAHEALGQALDITNEYGEQGDDFDCDEDMPDEDDDLVEV